MDLRKLKEQLEQREASLTAELETVMRELESINVLVGMLDKYDIDVPAPVGGDPVQEVTAESGRAVIVSRAWHRELWDHISSTRYRTAAQLAGKIANCTTKKAYKVLHKWTQDGLLEARVAHGQTHEYRRV